jgi:integrase
MLAGLKSSADAGAADPPEPQTTAVSQTSAAHTGVSAMPLFSKIARAYIEMRRENGAGRGEVQTLELRLKTFLDVMGDRPVDDYFPTDLQTWVTRMRFWSSNVTKRMEGAGVGAPSLDSWNTNDILKANQTLAEKPPARKTMQDGYVTNIRTMMRYGMLNHRYRDPFAGAKIRYPKEFALSLPRESIDTDVLNRLFANGVASGLLDEAILPLLLYLTSRRLSLCLYLRGSDIRLKHGVYVAQVPSLVQAGDGSWTRVPIKTEDSATYFVLHDLLREIGLVDWMMARGDAWVFEAAHRYADPSKSVSQLLNRRLRQAGALGASIETVHSLRGDAIDVLREDEIRDRATRLQSGHALSDLHDQYGARALNRVDSWSIATRDLPGDIDWSVFRGLDFDALAKGRRGSGPKKKGK